MGAQFIFDILGFIFLDMVGIPGNVVILYAFFHTLMCHRKVTLSEIILSKLALSNLLVILSQGIPFTLKTFWTQNVFNNLGCKITLYVYCVGRAMTICVTSLLGCFQCLLIIPFPCRWLHWRESLIKNLSSIMISLWCFNLFVCSTRLTYASAQGDENSSTLGNYTELYNFCYVVFPSRYFYLGSRVVLVIRDVFFLGAMTVSSCYLLYMFYQHGKQAKHLPGLHLKHAEIQAAKAVVALLVLYLFSFGMDSIFWIFTLCVSPGSMRLVDAQMFFASCYSAVGPLVIILTNKKVQTGLKAAPNRREFPVAESISKHIH
ncbi:PREDICTED: vomeronasal type-1 receptor 3-like [Crocodylus porosus]|uniref:vomeronasal type-1 receptor 3-like n=1 Tax=Crocodylus porosus TaxID=8502 RepID=UPI00093E7FAB|nr:PREDICTED: vomeronasal type-1 receptor 3-like [Crocodylus porosus]